MEKAVEKVEKGLVEGFFSSQIVENSVEIWESFRSAVLRISKEFGAAQKLYSTGFAEMFRFFQLMII